MEMKTDDDCTKIRSIIQFKMGKKYINQSPFENHTRTHTHPHAHAPSELPLVIVLHHIAARRRRSGRQKAAY